MHSQWKVGRNNVNRLTPQKEIMLYLSTLLPIANSNNYCKQNWKEYVKE
jgi:hypothetical protein